MTDRDISLTLADSAAPKPAKTGAETRETRRIGVLLIPDFALLAYAAALEPFRAANRISGRALYSWAHVSPVGGPVQASNGVMIAPDCRVGEAVSFDMLLVCAGGNPALFNDPQTFAWLRRLSRAGTQIAGISGGPFVMARAGLLDGYSCTIHWEHFPAFVEEFPTINLTRRLFEIDRDRLTCSGGTAALDMMFALIERDHGHELAADMIDLFVHTNLREADGPQRVPLRERMSVAHPKLVKVLEAMETHIENPRRREHLATAAKLSVRQLERLFRAHLGRSIASHYMDLRLRRARVLLMQSTMSVIDVAVATGFTSASHFSRAYRKRFGHPPRKDQRASLR
jgi:transcriptional regulator GlxA family with amidase domain